MMVGNYWILLYQLRKSYVTLVNILYVANVRLILTLYCATHPATLDLAHTYDM